MIRKRLLAGIAVLLLVLVVGAAFLYLGLDNVAADVPHSRPVYALLDTLRDRSITKHAQGIAVPANLSEPARIRKGAGLYGEMCRSCHLAPGVEATELAQGLYPRAPKLASASDMPPAEQFWIVKHG